MKEDQPKENNTEENEKNLTVTAGTIIEYMKSEHLSVEDTICVLAIATSLVNVESTVDLLMKHVKIVAVPMPKPGTMMQKPASN